MDELIQDLQIFSTSLAKLGFVKQANDVDRITSNILLSHTIKLGGADLELFQRKALLIKAKALVRELQAELGEDHEASPSLARINYEIKREIEDDNVQ